MDNTFYSSPYPPQIPQNYVQAPLTRQQIVRVNGRESINALRMAPNSELLALDNTAAILWVCTSDGVGAVRAVPYDITPHKDVSVTDDLEHRITTLEQIVLKMNGGIEHESGTGSTKRAKTSSAASTGKDDD